ASPIKPARAREDAATLLPRQAAQGERARLPQGKRALEMGVWLLRGRAARGGARQNRPDVDVVRIDDVDRQEEPGDAILIGSRRASKPGGADALRIGIRRGLGRVRHSDEPDDSV